MEVLYKKALETQPNRREQFSQKRKEEMTQRFSTFKDAQAKFVANVVSNGQTLVNEVINSETNYRSFVDIFIFDLPPGKHDNANVKLENNWLYIELMEGTKRMPYSEFWTAVDTQSTLSMLQTAFAPFKVYYGYFRKLGNVIQVRWDDKVPRWALQTEEEFNNKKNSNSVYRKKYNNDNRNNNNNNRDHDYPPRKYNKKQNYDSVQKYSKST